MTTPEGIPVLDALAKVLEDGDFGEYDALRKSLASTAGLGGALKGAKKVRKDTPTSELDEDTEPEPDGQLDLLGAAA